MHFPPTTPPNKTFFAPTPYPEIQRVEPPSDLAEPSPGIGTMVASLTGSLKNWMQGGLQTTPKEALEHRLETCRSCEFWNSEGFKGTGRCRKCGCSTWAKLRMATERCPIGKWEAVTPTQIPPDKSDNDVK